MFLLGSVAYRATMLRFTWTELIVPVALVALFPVIEWVTSGSRTVRMLHTLEEEQVS